MSDDGLEHFASSDDPTGGAVAAVMPFVTAIVALLLGVGLGLAIGWTSSPVEVGAEPSPPRDLTAAELARLCNEDETLTELEQAKDMIAFLDKEVEARSARVKELEAAAEEASEPKGASGSSGRGRDLARQLARARADLEEARSELEVVKAERDALKVELDTTTEELEQTRVALVDQTQRTHRAKEDGLVNKWYRFVNAAQLEICDRGNRRKLGRCREVVQDTLMTNSRRDRFAHCVRSGQETPLVVEIGGVKALPRFGEMVDEAQRQTKGWAVLFCDPTLPEGDGFLDEEHLPPTPPVLSSP